MSRRLAATLAAIACAFAAAAPAAAAVGPQISQAGSPSFPERAYSLRIPSDLALGASDVHVRENGQPVDQVGLASASQAGNGEFGTVLVIDTSKSMHGEAIAGAMEAARCALGQEANRAIPARIVTAPPIAHGSAGLKP